MSLVGPEKAFKNISYECDNKGDIPMPRGSTKKEERQYEHIKGSELKEGRSEKDAERIAASTINKERRERGETKGKKDK